MCTPMFIEALFIITAKTWKQLKPPMTDLWINMQYIYTVGFQLGNEDEIFPIMTAQHWRRNKSERKGQILFDFTHVWYIRKQSKGTNKMKPKQSSRFQK